MLTLKVDQAPFSIPEGLDCSRVVSEESLPPFNTRRFRFGCIFQPPSRHVFDTSVLRYPPRVVRRIRPNELVLGFPAESLL